jgi:hypothetical protein
MNSPDTSTVRNSRAFRAALADPTLGRIIAVRDYAPAGEIRDLNRPVFVVSCYSDTGRQIGTKFDQFVLLVQNSYMIGFVHTLAGGWLYHSHRTPLDITAFQVGVAKKFVGEQLYRRSPSDIARVLFLESVLTFERVWRIPVEARTSDPVFKSSVDLLTDLTAHFMLYHELGHLAVAGDPFYPFIRDRVRVYMEEGDVSDVPASARKVLVEEAEADLFSLACCVNAFAPRMSAQHLRAYLGFAARALTAMNIFYAMADDLHRINVDPQFPADVAATFALWGHRESLMAAFIATYPFDDTTVVCAADDALLDIPDYDSFFNGMYDSEALVFEINEDDRRFLQLIDLALVPGGNFDSVIDGTRVQWMLGED